MSDCRVSCEDTAGRALSLLFPGLSPRRVFPSPPHTTVEMSLEIQKGPSPEDGLFVEPLLQACCRSPLSHLPSGAQGHTSSRCPRDGRPPGTQIPGTDGKLVKGIQRPLRRREGRRGAAAWGEGKQVGSPGLSLPAAAAACPASTLKEGLDDAGHLLAS